MLVLKRKLDQSIMVGAEVEIKILAIHGDQVRIGIQAPHQVTVHRKEIGVELQRHHAAVLCDTVVTEGGVNSEEVHQLTV
jgi:carbon storage regulator